MTIEDLTKLCASMKHDIDDDLEPNPVLDIKTGWNQALDAVVRTAILRGLT